MVQPESMTSDAIMAAVTMKYGGVAESPGDKHGFPVGRAFAESVGYDPCLLDKLPPAMSESFTGAGNPQAYVDPKPGEVVLDLGCGAGLDLYHYAAEVGGTGRVYGLDLSKAMLDKARENTTAAGVGNVQLLHAPADEVPLPDGSVDLVTANGIYNLSPDKDAMMREVARLLRPGGRTIFAEIVLEKPLEEKISRNMENWFRCIGGALPEPVFLERLQDAGLAEARVLWKGRNARTGHPLSQSAVIRAEKPT